MSTDTDTDTGFRNAQDDPARRTPAPLAPRELLRWSWRQLTSMRTALFLLLLLALAAIPGSVIPQENVDSLRTSQWKQQHPDLTPIYERLGLFGVFHSVWFSAIYLLLVVSLVGCILPRTKVYWRGLRNRPPRPPRNLLRMQEYRATEVDDAGDLLDRAAAELKRRRFRVQRYDGAVAAERGYLREAGNLVFHVSVLLVLAGVAMGSLLGYQGGVIVVTGSGFSNSLSQYDDFRPGAFFGTGDLAPFSFTVHDFDVQFIQQGREAGMAHQFSASMTYRAAPGAPPKDTTISVNHPLSVDGTDVYLISHGYAPVITVRDGQGHIASSGPVVFLPEDDTFTSLGVVKVPDAKNADGKPEQLGLEGEFYPTYAFTMQTGPFSAFPDDKNPAISMVLYRGDLGIDSGRPQSVYALDKTGLKKVLKPNGTQFRVDLMKGQTVQLPDGMGSVTLDGVRRYVKLQVSRSPGDWLALLGVSLALLGLLGSLFIRPRRVWVRVGRSADGRSLVEVAGLDRSSGGDLGGEVDSLADHLGVPAASVPREES
ncbi:MAG: cytochrome c biogenesis protein ResB [Marmoricola sp.]